MAVFSQNSKNLMEAFCQHGILQLPDDTYGRESIDRWNSALDPLFAAHVADEKVYVSLEKLYELNIFQEMLTAPIRSLLVALMPDVVLHSLSSLEIAANNPRPHLGGGNAFEGWHNDVDVNMGLDWTKPHYGGLMIYLDDVEEDDAPFELIPRTASEFVRDDHESVKVVGKKGTAFIFNKLMCHRPNCNLSKSKRRRIINFQFQNNYLQNNLLQTDSMSKLQDLAAKDYPDDDFFHYLLGKMHKNTSKFPVHNSYLKPSWEFVDMEANEWVKLSWSKIIINKVILKSFGLPRKVMRGKEKSRYTLVR